MSRTDLLAAAVVALSALGAGCERSTPGAAGPSADAARPAAAVTLEHVLHEVLAEPDPFARASHLATLLRDVDASALPALRAALVAQDADRGAAEIELLVRAWARHDPERASRWAFTRSPLGYRIAAIVPAIESWAARDPEAAARFTRGMSLLGGNNKEAAEVALVRGWFVRDRDGLAEYIRDLGIGFERQRALRIFAREWIQRDGPEPVRRWAEALPDADERLKLAAFRQVGTELAKADPDAAVAFCRAHCDGPFGAEVRKLIATQWALHDPLAVVAWLETLPESKSRYRALRSAYRSWLRIDREAALAWVRDRGLEGLEPWLRPLAGMYAHELSQDQPEEAMRWAALIEDAWLRESAYVSFARRWRQQDEAAAQAWLAHAPLSEEARTKVMEPLTKQRRRPPEAAPGPGSRTEPGARTQPAAPEEPEARAES